MLFSDKIRKIPSKTQQEKWCYKETMLGMQKGTCGYSTDQEIGKGYYNLFCADKLYMQI